MKLLFYIACIAIVACTSSQIFKVAMNVYLSKRIPKFYEFFEDGNFPSSHSSFTSAMTATIWLYVYNMRGTENIDVYIWIAVAITVHTAVVIRDALGVRFTVQRLSDIMLKMLEYGSLNDEKNIDRLAQTLKKKSGHKPHEVLGGICWGVIVALIGNIIYTGNYMYLYIMVPLMVLFIIFASVYLKKKKNSKKVK
ncbi:MAG: divergent PAP2 family protein [Clostridia bacterium]|nr:divergent PAP2 family protein [Clostridia bacterium]